MAATGESDPGFARARTSGGGSARWYAAEVRPSRSSRMNRTFARARTALVFGLSVFVLAAPLAPRLAIAKERPRQRPAPQIQIDKSKVDLTNHRLELRLSTPPAQVELRVISESSEVLAEETRDFTGREAGSVLELDWTPASPAPVARIDIKAHDTAGGFAGVAVVAWSLTIPHEEVVFRTDSAELDAPERPKLESSLQKITAALRVHGAEFGRPTLFIAGHTDTVGNDTHNLKLSQARAQAIARWFLGHGVGIGVAYEGFGESTPAVKTPDDTDEPRNRRVDYILSIDEPRLASAAPASFRPSWKRVR